MEEKKNKRDGSGLLRILIIIIFILVIIYIFLNYKLLNFDSRVCSKYINPLNILYVDGTNEWASDCKRIKVENFEVDVREYSFDNGITWQESNIYNVCSEGIVEVKIRDANQKILGEGTFNVTNLDNIPPELEVPGDITVNVGSQVDLKEDVSALDNESGLKGGVVISPSTIDTYKIGETKVTYSVVDNAGNKTTKLRTVTVTGSINVTSFYITPNSVYLKRGDNYTLKPVYYPSDIPSRLITWSSNNTAVATVDRKGVITAIGNGSAVITATLANRKASMTVVVGNNTQIVQPVVYPNSVNFSSPNYTIKVGESLTTKIALSPSNATTSFTYKSSDPSIATYTNGVLRGISVGETTIVVTTANGKIATAKVNVIGINDSSGLPTSIVTSPANISLEKGNTQKLTVSVLPSNATGYTVKCTSNNTSVATIDSNYNVKGVNNGTAVITCETSNGKTDSSVVTVSDKGVTSLVINPSSVTLTKGNTQKLSFTVKPSGASSSVSCTSNNTSVATIGSDNVIHGIATGSAVITCKTSNGVSATVNVNVNPNVVTMYRYRDSSTKKVQCNCREESTGKCDYYYDCGCTNKWVCTSTIKGGCPCPQGDTRCGEWQKTCNSRCCHDYIKETVCSTCTETVWSNWSEWSTTPVTATSTRQVETKQVEQ